MDKFCLMLIIILTCHACGQDNDFDQIPEQQLHDRARKLSLEKRYDLYLEVYKSQTPRNPVLAEDMHALGSSARAFVINKASLGDLTKIGAALSVLSRYNERCTPEERDSLMSGISKASIGQQTRQALIERVKTSCNAKKSFE